MTPRIARRISVDIDSLLAGSSLTLGVSRRGPTAASALVFRLPFWAMRGRAVLRQRLARMRDWTSLRCRIAPRRWTNCGGACKRARHVVLVTTADPALARQVAEHLGIAEVEAGRAPRRQARELGWIRARVAALPVAQERAGLSAVPPVA